MYWPYWRTGAQAYDPMVNYYRWMEYTPPLSTPLHTKLRSTLPTIVWAKDQSWGIGEHLVKYTPLYHDGKPTPLFFLRDQVNQLTSDQLTSLASHHYTLFP